MEKTAEKKIFKFIFSAVLGKTLEKINLNIFFLLFFGKMVEKKNLNIFFSAFTLAPSYFLGRFCANSLFMLVAYLLLQLSADGAAVFDPQISAVLFDQLLYLPADGTVVFAASTSQAEVRLWSHDIPYHRPPS